MTALFQTIEAFLQVTDPFSTVGVLNFEALRLRHINLVFVLDFTIEVGIGDVN